MKEKLALIFAYHFPPENAIGGVRPYRFYKYLSRLGYRCYVISAADVSALPEVEGIGIPDPFVTKPRQGIGWQIERAIRRFLLPGVAGCRWAVQAYRAALRFLEQNQQYEQVTVFSTFPPVGAHLAAYLLSRRKRLPWIADYRDPLGGNPVFDHISSFTKSNFRKAERIFVRAADFTIANTDAVQDNLKRIYPDRADRIELIWNGFDPEERVAALPVTSSSRKIVAHVGDLYGGRNVSPILESLRRLIDCRKLRADQFQVFLVGPAVEDSIPGPEFIELAAQQGWVKIEPDRIPQVAARAIIQTADAFLLVQPQSAIQVPGKLFEYLQIGRPILAFVPTNSSVERILEKSGVPYRCVHPSSTQAELDNGILEFFQFNEAQSCPNQWFENQFNVKAHSQRIADLIELAHGRRAPGMVQAFGYDQTKSG
jgi:glycosyltransferase involved in cell wall biosynthesis